MLATTIKDTNAMQGQRANISAEFLAALSTQKYELKCHGFVNSPSASIPYKSGVLLQAKFIRISLLLKHISHGCRKAWKCKGCIPNYLLFLKFMNKSLSRLMYLTFFFICWRLAAVTPASPATSWRLSIPAFLPPHLLRNSYASCQPQQSNLQGKAAGMVLLPTAPCLAPPA